MFDNLKSTIKKLAVKAVIFAENTLGSSQGKEKKTMAIKYVISKLPLSFPFKKLVAILLSKFIDDAIEFAVEYVKTGDSDGTK